MRKHIFILPWTAVIFLTSCASSWAVAASAFDDAVAVWHMADLNDSAGKNSPLTVQGNVKCGIELQGAEREASLRRGGDGRVARLDGGWLDAGQGADGELNLGGKAMTIAIRVCDPSGKWKGTLMAKHGGNGKLVYNIYNTGAVFVAQVGNDAVAGVHQVATPIGPLVPTDWHDVVLRWDGKTFQLFVDGGLRDDDEAVGVPRQGNTEPCLIGAESQEGKIKAEFRGLVDHAALWNRALSDTEIATISGVAKLADKRPDYYDEKYRPQFHFTAKRHWINDPNGLFYYDGVYHLCFQHMPPGRGGAGYKSWGHAVSTDLVHWKQLASAITPHKTWGGCWSGSAVVDWNNTTGFQTGKEKPIVLIVTMGGNPHSSPRCTQCIAYSVDGGKTFTYYENNPVLGHIVENNRDPKVLWHEPTKKWIMALYLKENDYGLYASPDLKKWEHLCNVTLPGVSECPDLFELAVDGNPANKKWVFWGANGGFLLGSFDGRSFKPEGAVQKADYGVNFYAAQTWSDIPPSDGRLIQTSWMGWSWINYPGMPFDQQHSFPTEVTLRTTPDGIEMFRVPVREIEKLRLKGHNWSDVVLKPGDNPFSGLTGDLFDIVAEFELGNAKQFGITVRGQPLQYDIASKTLSCLGKSAPLSPENGRIKLRILVDRASLEVFANDGRTVMTMCFLPPDDNKNLALFAKDGDVKVVSAEVYPLKSIWPQPATESKPKGNLP